MCKMGIITNRYLNKMKLIIFIFLGLLTISITCKSSSTSKWIDHKSEIEFEESQVKNTEINEKMADESTSDVLTQVHSIAEKFVMNLKSGKKISSFFSDNWMLIYHEDNRCDGSTDGQIANLISAQIDTIIRLQVKNDGDGWACDKQEPKSYALDFDIKKYIANWERFEIPNYESENKNIIYIVGAGESDYLKLYYNNSNLIVKLEYRSEDPG